MSAGFLSLFKHLLGGFRPKSRRKRKAPIRRDRHATLRPRLEPLEDRTMPSVSIVVGGPWTQVGPGPVTGSSGVQGTSATSDITGPVTAIAVDPSNAARAFIGTQNGGVWRSTNFNAAPGSVTFTPLTDNFPSLAISSITIDPLNPNIIFAGTGNLNSNARLGGDGRGVLVSMDGGNTWAVTGDSSASTGMDGEVITSIVATHTTVATGQVILAATADGGSANGSGLYVSKDTGQTWTRTAIIAGLQNLEVSSLAADTSSSTRFYAGIAGALRFAGGQINPATGLPFAANTPIPGLAGIYVGDINASTGDITWTKGPLNSGTPITVNLPGTPMLGATTFTPSQYAQREFDNAVRIDVTASANFAGTLEVAVVGQDPQPIYALASRYTGIQISRLYRSISHGNTFLEVPNLTEPFTTGTGDFNFAIAADPTNPNLFYLSGDTNAAGFGNVERVTVVDSPMLTSVFTSVVGAGAGSTSPFANGRSMVVDSGGNVIEGTNGGLFRLVSPATAPKWQSNNGNLSDLETVAAGFDPLNNVAIGSFQGQGTAVQSAPGSASFSQFLPIGNLDLPVDSTSIGGQTFRYAMSGNLTGFIYQTVNSSNTLQSTTSVGLRSTSSNPPLSGLGQFNGSEAGTTGTENIPFALNAVNPTSMMVGFQGLYEDAATTAPDNQGNVVSDISGNIGLAPLERVTAIVYGGFSGGVAAPTVAIVGTSTGNLFLRTGDFLTKFTQVAVGGTGAIQQIVVDPQNWQRVYVLRGNQVFETDNILTTPFTVIANGANDTLASLFQFGVVKVTSLALYDDTPGVAGDSIILVGTNEGVFRAFTPSAPPSSANPLTWNKLGSGLPNALVTSIDVTGGITALGTTFQDGSASVNEIQQVTLSGSTESTFTLSFNGKSTAALAYGSTALQVQTALNGLSNIGPSGSVTVVRSGNVFTITFGGTLAHMNVSQIVATGSQYDADGIAANGTGSIVIGTLGRGLWRLDNVSSFIHSVGTLVITAGNNANPVEFNSGPPGSVVVSDGITGLQLIQTSTFDNVLINALTGIHTIRIDSNTGGAQGSTSFVTYPIVVNAGNIAGNQVLIEDSLGTTGAKATVTAGTVGSTAGDTLFGAGGKLTVQGLTKGTLTLNLPVTAGLTNTANVQGTAFKTTINDGASNDVFNLSNPTGSLAAITQAVTINGGTGFNTATVSDAKNPAATTLTVSSSFVGFGAGAILFYSGLDALTVNGSATVADTFSVVSTLQGTSYFLNGGAGNDAFFVATNVTIAGAVRTGLAGPVFIDGGGGSNAVNLQEVARTTGDTVYVTPTAFTNGNSTLFVGYKATGGKLTSLNFMAGTGNDVVIVTGVPQGMVPTINLGQGFNYLYVYTTPTSGITNIVAIGGPGTNVLYVIDQTNTAAIHNFASSPTSGVVDVDYPVSAGVIVQTVSYSSFFQVINNGSATNVAAVAAQNYITALFQKILGRLPSPAELAQFTALLQADGALPVVAALEAQPAAQARIVTQYFLDITGSPPSASQLSKGVSLLQSGATEEAMLGVLLGSPAQFLTAAFRTKETTLFFGRILGRGPSSSELSFYVNGSLDLRRIRESILASNTFFQVAQ
jgi:hypothetical protein